MFNYTDQLGNCLYLMERPKRIVSLVPSQSELLWELGLRDELVGITKFCIHPEEMYRSVQRIGGTKKLDLDQIRRLNPDLIIGNKEENERSQIEALQAEFPVWMSDIYNFEDAFEMIRSLGEICNKEDKALAMIATLERSLLSVRGLFAGNRVAYFIWNNPYMFAAKNTFIDHVLNYLGFENALSELERYPSLDDSALRKIKPEICFLSSEPFPFRERHVKELQKKLPAAKIVIVDGEVFSWYGSRLLELESYVERLATLIQ